MLILWAIGDVLTVSSKIKLLGNLFRCTFNNNGMLEKNGLFCWASLTSLMLWRTKFELELTHEFMKL